MIALQIVITGMALMTSVYSIVSTLINISSDRNCFEHKPRRSKIKIIMGLALAIGVFYISTVLFFYLIIMTLIT